MPISLLTEEDVVGGMGIDDQIPDLYSLGVLPLAKGGVELNVSFGRCWCSLCRRSRQLWF